MARIKGNNITEVINPTVELVSYTCYPIETLFSLWHGSRYPHRYDTVELRGVRRGLSSSIKTALQILKDYPEYNGVVSKVSEHDEVSDNDILADASYAIEDIAKLVVKCDVPASESVAFTFVIDNASVALREQMVRTKVSSFWTQTSRTADLTTMDVRVDQKIRDNEEAYKVYSDTVNSIRNAYKILSELGIPTEDIRLSPECRTHRVYWMTNLRALRPVLSKRTDWMAQSTLWSPIVSDVMNIISKLGLSETLDINPNVKYSDGKVTYHKYDNENMDRYTGKDPQPVDPLWLSYKGFAMPYHTNIEMYDDMKSRYIKIWSKDLCDLLMWDKNNPEKLGPFDRPLKWFEENKDYLMKDTERDIFSKLKDLRYIRLEEC